MKRMEKKMNIRSRNKKGTDEQQKELEEEEEKERRMGRKTNRKK